MTTEATAITIQVKWGKEVIEVDVPTSLLTVTGSTAVTAFLQDVIQMKTNVPKHRQKIMCSKPKNVWKGILKDDDASIDWSVLRSPPAPANTTIQFLLMGSADAALLAPPMAKTVFLEDMKEDEIAAMEDPAGLVNLGNTCYLNSVVQCLRVIPEFQSAISASGSGSTNANSNSSTTAPTANANRNFFVNTLHSTYQQLSKQTLPVTPMLLVQATKMIFPQFAQLSPANGRPMQQDAEEFYSSLLSYLAGNMGQTPSTSLTGTGTGSGAAQNPIDTIFGIQFKETVTCDEFTDPFASTTTATTIGEPPVVRYDMSRKLICNIQGGGVIPSANNSTASAAAVPPSSSTATGTTVAADSNIPTNITFINDGIQLGLTTKIVKHSQLLQRDAMWTSQQRITKLPQILTIQFGRFYWKLTPDSADHTGVKCKIMKPITFHNTFDVNDFCTNELQSVIQQSRQKQMAIDEELLNAKLTGKDVIVGATNDDETKMNDGDDDTSSNKKAKTTTTSDNSDVAAMEEDDDDLQAALAMSIQGADTLSAAAALSVNENETSGEIFGPGIPNDFLGYYELFAVVTHKGRDADGGHYMAWVKADHQSSSKLDTAAQPASGLLPQKNDSSTSDINEDWYVFDDDEVSPCKTEDVLKLKGGGDWHMSYLNFYRVVKDKKK